MFLIKYKNFFYIFIFFFFINNLGFDYKFYISTYNDIKNSLPWEALQHYLNKGFYEKRKCANPVENNIFDWKYYCQVNNLRFQTEQEAIRHYNSIGNKENLRFCKSYNIAIILHLYNLEFLDEITNKINNFMDANKLNNFLILITIPIDKNITNYRIKKYRNFSKKMKKDILKQTPYHKNLIKTEITEKLYDITSNLRSRLNIDTNKIRIIFCENRGLDIGGFFLALDYLKKNKINPNFLVKLHSKTHPLWRNLLFSILDIKINKLLNYYDYISTCNLDYILNQQDPMNTNMVNLTKLFKKFALPPLDFSFCAGTMFIVNAKIIDILSKYNFIELFNELNPSALVLKNENLEHAYERFFGYLVKYLNFKCLIVGLTP